MYIRICQNCGEEFTTRDRRSIFCQKKECRRARERFKYNQNKIECVCKLCGEHYFASPNSSKEYCSNCVRHDGYTFRKFHTVKTVCKYCNAVLSEDIVPTTKICDDVVTKFGVCENCKSV